MTAPRRLALFAGLLYLVTHVTSIVGLTLYDPVLNDPGYVTGPGADGRVIVGAVLEGICAIAIVGTAVTLWPVISRHSSSLALAYAGLRVLEAGIIAVGIVSLLAVVTLRQDPAGADPATLTAIAHALVAVHDWTFMLGPNFVLGVSTTVLAGLLLRSGLVPRIVPILGLIGGPLIFLSSLAIFAGLYEQVSVVALITAIPVFGWELGLAGRLVFKGFRPAGHATDQKSSSKPTEPVTPTW